MSYNTYLKQVQEDPENVAKLNKKLGTIDTLLDSQAKTVKDTYTQQIKDSEADYEDAYRENAVQKKVNEFYIAEEAANMGLTNSGLNRTQITANQLSYANNKAKLDQQRQSMVDALTREMNAKVADVENSRLSYKQAAQDEWDADNKAVAQNLYTEDVKAAAEVQKAQYDYLTKQAELSSKTAQTNNDNATAEREKIYTHLQSYENDPDYAAQLIDAYCAKYDIDPTTQLGSAELTSLLKSAGMTLNEYKNYISNGTIYTTAAQYNAGNTNGRTVWNYKTDGKQKYKIEVVNDTINWLGGVDRNATVKIYYADGTPVTKNEIRLSDLSRDVAKEITKLTKGSGNEGKVEILTLDLSKEKLG